MLGVGERDRRGVGEGLVNGTEEVLVLRVGEWGRRGVGEVVHGMGEVAFGSLCTCWCVLMRVRKT